MNHKPPGAKVRHEFADKSTAPPLEKARRVLRKLANQRDCPYFFDDGYPRTEIHTDAAATLEVLNDLAAGVLPAPAPAAQPPQYRLLCDGDRMQDGDEQLLRDAQTWEPLAGGFGIPWDAGFKPVRRLVEAQA